MIETDDDLVKTREIRFSMLSSDPCSRAVAFLNTIHGVTAQPGEHGYEAWVSYNLLENSFEELEAELERAGFYLDESLLPRMKRALIHHTEDVQRQNLKTPDRASKNQEIYVQVYGHHLHGDHDDTPEEWREYR